MARYLRSKSQRAMLWYAADGKCQICGEPLGEDWQADHIIPWSVSERTELAEMQALCAGCNRKKGASMGLRGFQEELRQAGHDIRTGAITKRKILVQAEPGSGKEAGYVTLASELLPDVCDRICWIVPRDSLRTQAEEAFKAKWLQDILGHHLEARACVNDEDPCRETQGFITTYQAVMVAFQRADDEGEQCALLSEFAKHKYLLILDEPHHVEFGSLLADRIDALAKRAVVLVLGSGTLERGNGKRIYGVPYKLRDNSTLTTLRWSPAKAHDDWVFINNSRYRALKEQSIIRLQFSYSDADLQWEDRDRKDIRMESLAGAETEEARQGIFIMLRTEAALELLNKAYFDWLAYRRTHARSRLLVVASRQDQAREFLRWLRDKGETRASIATTDEGPLAQARIKAFRSEKDSADRLDVLVTVGMAYEGMNCKQITHLCCLTHIRSRPWIHQMLGRAQRFDEKAGKWGDQWAYIYAPDDVLMREICEAIRDEQEAVAREGGQGPGGGGDPWEPTPKYGTLTDERLEDFQTAEGTSTSESSIVDAMRRSDMMSVPVSNVRTFIDILGIPLTASVRAPRAPMDEDPPSVRERRTKKRIENAVRQYEARNKIDFGTVNREIYERYNKSRTNMTEMELNAVEEWLKKRGIM